MLDLRRTAGFPLQCDSSGLRFANGTTVGKRFTVRLKDMKSELLNRSLTCPEIFYSKYVGVDNKGVVAGGGFRMDLTMIPPNLAGIEYVKTRGRMNGFVSKRSRYTAPAVIEVIYGWATVILQRPKSANGDDGVEIEDGVNMGELQNVSLVKLQRGRKLVVPPGFGFVVINTRQSLLVFSVLRKAQTTRPLGLSRYRGGSYYIIRKNARQEIVMNPNYKNTPEFIRKGTTAKLLTLGVKTSTPLFRQVVSSPDTFEWLKFPSRVDWSSVVSRLTS